MSAKKAIEKFNAVAKANDEKLKKNPFSETYTAPKFDKNAPDYARPPPGSKTEARARKAGDYVMREIVFLCDTIWKLANYAEPPECVVKFGPLFHTYSFYSDKLVGMLIRARKYGLVAFDGEMLYQRQDDNKDVRLLKTPTQIRESMKYSGDPVNIISTK